MPQPKRNHSFGELRGSRLLRQFEMGTSAGAVSRAETGRGLPGPKAAKAWAAALTAASPENPVTPLDVLAACRVSMKRALKKRAAEACAGRKTMVGA
jgi:hypothetical protein